jgi:hypothetical protein
MVVPLPPHLTPAEAVRCSRVHGAATILIDALVLHLGRSPFRDQAVQGVRNAAKLVWFGMGLVPRARTVEEIATEDGVRIRFSQVRAIPKEATKASKSTKACAYLRTSADDPTGLQVQRRRLKELADREGYRIIRWYSDKGRSGSRDSNNQTERDTILADSETAEWEVILCSDLSRFCRLSTFDESFVREMLALGGKRLHTVAEGMIDWKRCFGVESDRGNGNNGQEAR